MLAALTLPAAFGTAPVLAQCQLAWQPGDGLPGATGPVYAARTWDPDGPGPAAERILLAGAFDHAGTVRGAIVTFEPTTASWATLATSISGFVLALQPMPNGDLYAAGSFNDIEGSLASGLARWNGAVWQPIGGLFPSGVTALGLLPNGDLAVGGTFVIAGGQVALGLARWDGASWSPLASSSFGRVDAMTNLPNGDLIVVGTLTAVDGVAVGGIARWDGSNWSAPAASLTASSGTPGITAALVRANGDLVVAGNFDSIDGVAAGNVATWDGQIWSPLPAGLPAGTQTLAELPSGQLVAAGVLGATAAVTDVLRFDGSSWAPLGAGMSGTTNGALRVGALVVDGGGELHAFGSFRGADGRAARNAARWDGAGWAPLTPGTDDQLWALVTTANGDVVAGGDFAAIAGVDANGVARLSPQGWTALGGGVDGSVRCALELPNGDLIVGGDFQTAGGATAREIARWDGAAWSPLGAGLSGSPLATADALATLPNGDLVVGGFFLQAGTVQTSGVARWDGASWQAIGGGIGGGVVGAVRALAVLPNGDLFAGGQFTTAGGAPAAGIARWDGAVWSEPGGGFAGIVEALAVSPAGELFAAHGTAVPFRVSRWDGQTWQQVGGDFDGVVRELSFLPDGSALAVGWFASVGGQPARGVARWNGVAWTGVDAGVEAPFGNTATPLPDGDVLVGGGFLRAGGQASAYLARFAPTCPATATAVGSGCAGSAGLHTLAADSLPWLGATFRSRAGAMPASSLAVEVRGLGALATPLPSLLPQGVAGCDLLVTPDVLSLRVPTAGEVEVAVPIPTAAPLVGVSFRQQLVVFELGAAGITAVTSSNALVATLGTF